MESLRTSYSDLEQRGVRFIIAPDLAGAALTGFSEKHGSDEAHEREDELRASFEPNESGLSD